MEREKQYDVREMLQMTKKRKTRLEEMFKALSGGKTDIEAVELSLGRDRPWQASLLKCCSDLGAIICNSKVSDSELLDHMQILVKSGLIGWIVRLLSMRLPETKGKGEKEAIFKRTGKWRVAILYVIKLTHYILKNPINELQIMSLAISAGMMKALNSFIDGGKEPMALFWAVNCVYIMCKANESVHGKIISSGGLSNLGKILLRDGAQRIAQEVVVDWYVNEHANLMKDFEEYMWHDIVREGSGIGAEEGDENGVYKGEVHKAFALLLARQSQEDVVDILLEISCEEERRFSIIQNKTVLKALLRWLETPIVTSHDIKMIRMVLNLMSSLCKTEDLCHVILEKHNLGTLLELMVFAPEPGIVMSCLQVIKTVSTHAGRCREKLSEQTGMLIGLTRFMFSTHIPMQEESVVCIGSLAETPESCARLLDSGITYRDLSNLRVYREPSFEDDFDRIRRLFTKYGQFTWKQKEEDYNRYAFGLDATESEKYKEAGNERFKRCRFMEAIHHYSHAIEVLPQIPPSSSSSGKEAKENLRTWWSLPPVLYSNRAQAYLKLEYWENAIKDCTFAVAKCIGVENPDAKKYMQKSVFRRAKAYISLKQFALALNDMAYLCRTDKKDSTDWPHYEAHYREALVGYRKVLGCEPIRRCVVCRRGEGEKLKHCSECAEVYCSKECQVKDWEEQKGHQFYCDLYRKN